MTHSNTHILARLEAGLRTDAAHLVNLEEAMLLVLQRGRGLGAEYGSAGDWSNAWGHHWDLVEIILRRIHSLVAKIQDDIQSPESGRHAKALQTWAALQIEDAQLEQTLAALQGQALATHLNVIRACGQALRMKLELLKNHSSAEVDEQVRKLLDRISRARSPNSGSAIDQREEYQHAAVELQKEKNKFMGFMDVVKGMFTWVESAQERTDKNCLQESF